MIEWVIGFLVAKWWVDKEEKKKNDPKQMDREYKGFVEYEGMNYGYVKDGESVQDLQ